MMPTEGTDVTQSATVTDTTATAATTDTTDTAQAEAAESTDATTTPTQDTPTSAVPAKYELALPKDSPLPAVTLERIAATARAQGLSNAAAQSMVDAVNAEAVALKQSDAAALKAQEDAEKAAWEPGKGAKWLAQDKQWKDTALKDTEIGGTPDKLKASQDKATRVVEKFGNAGIKEFLQVTGLGSHPDFIRMLSKIGSAFSESSLVVGGSPNASAPRSQADILYGKKDAA